MICGRCKHEINPSEGVSYMGMSVTHRVPDTCIYILQQEIYKLEAENAALAESVGEQQDRARQRAERIAALEAENAALREDKARLMEALEEITAHRELWGQLAKMIEKFEQQIKEAMER